jgi:general secretion pathway protein M
MQSVAGELQARAGDGAAIESTNESLVVLVDRTAREAGLGSNVTGQTPTGESGIRVRLEQAPFDSIVLWMAALEQRYGVLIDSASIDRSAQSGLVNASLVLTRPGG